MQFTRDDSLQIATPQNLSTVDLPFTVSWKADEGTAGAKRTAVFIDRYPMPPGADLRSIVDQDANCRGTDACLDATYLSRVFGIYTTTESEITVQTLPVRANSGGGDSHFATIVPLDASGKRAGEALWFVSFQVTK